MGRIQMDIVDITKSPVRITQDKTYQYVLAVLDVFSRFIILRPLQTKSSAEVATHVVQIFSDIDPPRIVQTDQGTEFKGVLEKVMDKLYIKIIHSRPYHPQSQGKVIIACGNLYTYGACARGGGRRPGYEASRNVLWRHAYLHRRHSCACYARHLVMKTNSC